MQYQIPNIVGHIEPEPIFKLKPDPIPDSTCVDDGVYMTLTTLTEGTSLTERVTLTERTPHSISRSGSDRATFYLIPRHSRDL